MNDIPEALQIAQTIETFEMNGCAEFVRSQDARIAELEAENARLRARKPMTDYQLRKIIEMLNREYIDDAEGWGYGDFAKAIEANHGIGGGNEY